jgi:signal transduction histidine kinase/ActR/RegA family two-component response regulator
LKKRVITGLISIFVVVVVGGGLVSHIMAQLNSVNRSRTHIDRASRTINKLDLMVLNTVTGIEYVQHGDEEVRKLIDEVNEIQLTMSELEDQIMSRTFADQSCGVCHQRPERLVRNLHMITQRMEETFSDLIMLTSILVTGGVENALGRVLSEMGATLESYHTHVKSLDNILTPMTEHINVEVSSNIARIKRTHDATIIVTTLFVLLGIVVLASAMTRPIRQLSKGTEAIVKGNYDHRIEMKGRDELATLAERFNYMAEVLSNREKRLHQKKLELEDLNETLERKIRDRTKALRGKQEEVNKKYLELESTNEEMQASYVQLQSTAAELEEAQSKLQDNYNILKTMNTELQRANEVKNKFLSIMSHELRTPLTVINGYLSLVLDKNYGNPSRELRDIITVVKEQGNSQLGLIEDLLDLTRIESGEFRLHKQGITPNDLIERAVENFRPKYEEKSITVEIHADNEMPEVYWDFQKMLQVFQNLLDNSLKFTPAGGKIEIIASSKSDFIELRVKDNGIGIPKDRLEQVFERFYQVDSSSTRRYGGSGLGLSIVREIVIAHNGKIFVESDEGHGTNFLLLMPTGEPEKPMESDSLSAGGDGFISAPRGDGQTILVVDDDEAFLKMMKMILPKEGYRVHYTSDSTKVIQYTKKHKADLIMLDLMMPEMDGYEVCRKVRKDAEVRNTPILVVSAAGGKEVTRRVFEAGADEHITKPFDQQDILYRINYLLDRAVKLSMEEESEGETDGGFEEEHAED